MNRWGKKLAFYGTLLVLSAVYVIPVLYMLITAFKSRLDAQTVPAKFFPREWTLNSFRTLFNDPGSPVFSWLLNSLVIATVSAVSTVTICSLAAYALARMRFPGRDAIFFTIIGFMFIPGFVFLMPNFELMNKLEWLDTYQVLIVPGLASAFNLFFMRQFFLSLPVELEESARIDGAGPFKTFFLVVLPNAKPALGALLILAFLGSWNDFIWPLYTLFSDEKLTLPIGLARLQGAYTIDFPVIMAGATLAAVPVLILFIFLQRQIIQGVATSGVKG